MQTNVPLISIIIPVVNEADYIEEVLQTLQEGSTTDSIKEILVVDGGSTDGTIIKAQTWGATVISSKKGRAAQMNYGAAYATGEVLFFLHGDTIPPKNFDAAILGAFQKGSEAGCFRLQFFGNSRFLRFFAWFTRFNVLICRGGDQSLFIDKNVFETLGGFNERYLVYEDVEIVQRIYKTSRFTILPEKMTTSSRRYLKRGMFALQWHFALIHLQHFLGAGPEAIHRYYEKHVLCK